jgi:hypothetical protein
MSHPQSFLQYEVIRLGADFEREREREGSFSTCFHGEIAALHRQCSRELHPGFNVPYSCSISFFPCSYQIEPWQIFFSSVSGMINIFFLMSSPFLACFF